MSQYKEEPVKNITKCSPGPDNPKAKFVIALYLMGTTKTICPLCNEGVDKLLFRFHIDNERLVIEGIKNHNPGWAVNDGACGRCVDYYQTEVVMQQRMLPEIGPYFPVKSADDFIILPTGLRLDADPRYTGKGVTICFIDSGFYLHPDLVAYRNRVREIVDITKDDQDKNYFMQPHHESWHGTMTSVVCAGDGYAGNGLYKGIASDAELVLLKVQGDDGTIKPEHIAAALEWVQKNHERHHIRIVNLSLGDNESVSYKNSKIDQLAEQLIANGIVVVAAVGNDEQGTIKAPANSPNVIAVGGINDNNSLENEFSSYHSSFGKTADELLKPEMIAHAMWIAAPILPGTEEKTEAEILYRLANATDADLSADFHEQIFQTKLSEELSRVNDVSFIRQCIKRRIQEAKYISLGYMHVDGTSFAAPIVCSVIAQLLEINPGLSPASIREILFSTSKRINSIAAERQGFGVIRPRRAILRVLKREITVKTQPSPFINNQQNTIEFYMQNDCASQVALSGTFNLWADDVLLLEPGKNGIWKIEIPMLPAGRYSYKFFVDNSMWVEDIDNPYREPDGFNGFNSLLIVKSTIN